MMKVITGEKFETSRGTILIHKEQDETISVGDIIEYDSKKYEIEQIFPPTRPDGKWSLLIKMATGNPTDNYVFYKGFEGEPEICLSIENLEYPTLHIWDGYYTDIFKDPPLTGEGWTGFTRDYHQIEGIFDNDQNTDLIEPEEYLADMKRYENKSFMFPETREVYDLICELLKRASEAQKKVFAARYD